MKISQITTQNDCSKACRKKCCVLEEPYLFHRSIFGDEEYKKAIKAGAKKGWFEDIGKNEHKIKYKKWKKQNNFYICPLISERLWHCRIYNDRPFDCRIWPAGICWDEKKEKIMLGVFEQDECHAIEKRLKSKEGREWLNTLKHELQTDEAIDFFKKNRSIVYDYADDLTKVHVLEKLTRAFKE